MNLTEATIRLNQLYASGHAYPFIEQAHRLLREVPDAPELAMLTLRALVELGWGGPARELLQARQDLNPSDPEVARLRDHARSLPNGRVQWSARADVYASNLSAFLRYRPEMDSLADSLPKSLSQIHLYQTIHGAYHISTQRAAGKLREWLAPLTVETQVKPPEQGQCGVPIIVGVSIGPLIRSLCELTRHLFLTYSHPVYLLEPDVSRFAAWLHCDDHIEFLNDERVYIFVGPDCAERLAVCLAEDPGLALPSVHVNQCGDALIGEQVQSIVQRVQNQRDVELGRLKDELEQRLQDRGSSYWAAHLKPPGAVLAVTSRYTTMLQYSARDTLHSLEELGYEPHILIEPSHHHQFSMISLFRKILEIDPVLLFFLDHLRYENPQVPRSIPFLTWIQDPMANLLCHRAGASIGPFDFVCGYFAKRCVAEFGYPKDRFFPADIPVSTRVFHDKALDGELQGKYACDISFVSNASTPVDRFISSTIQEYTTADRSVLELVGPRVLLMLDQDDFLNPFLAVREVVLAAVSEVGVAMDAKKIDFVTTNFAYRIYDWGGRQQSLAWVADWAKRTGRRFKIYGRGWDAHPTFAEFAAGPVEHGEPLRCAYRGATLSLQLIPSGFRHQRSYELLASGTLPLTRYCPADYYDEDGLPLKFEGLERISFRSAEEFESLAERFLADQPYRQAVSRDLREVVLKDFTYDAVVGRVMDAFRAVIGAQAIGAPNSTLDRSAAPELAAARG